MVEAQCFLDEDKFAANFPMTPAEADDGKIYAENGAFLMVDKPSKTATLPNKDMSDKGYPMGINYSTEKIYNQFTPGRRNFAMIAGEYLPRIGYVEPGMRICTNSVCWDDTVFPVDATSNDSPSVQMYKAVKAQLADPEGDPVYAFVIDDSELGANEKTHGKLVIGANVADAIGNVYAQITECYTNADTTLSFKIQFINKPEA
jgi:hypothetical protein